ncbi:xylan 1,4-beta-xylosidase [Actinocorallia sp. A-T 12471]|uniref:xylan 1,4-beta-xylosidase n=1 Tax=Actinocorallia sp. A-T 12471 TaxID=3089813 RepID=UPI0029D2C570|nr:xylan 1,4-beta-xylosidase [Actinocorallia sp. A-T 12471]MDX6738967.1 xylan 1,4-beta-xylosidase [Actinocorallia sp. A-T 12471]
MHGHPSPPQIRTATAPRRGRHGRRRPLWMIALAALVCGAALAALVLFVLGDDEERPGQGGVDVAQVGQINAGLPGDWTNWGFTHTQTSLEATPAAKAAVAGVPMLQVQHIMGFGADNPQITPGQYNWSSLDRRMKDIRETGGVPMITLCCAPDWMKGGPEGSTDWNHLEDSPLPKFFDAFAAQAADVARRYPDVKYYFVWNEFKGFFNQDANRWDFEGYTQLYNKVYAALKKVDSSLQVGGPYIPVNSYSGAHSAASKDLTGPWGAADQRALTAIEYWIEHKQGADFVVVDGSSLPEDRTAHEDPFRDNAKFSAVTEWLRGKTDLPAVWAEWYTEPQNSGWTAPKLQAVQADAMIHFAKSGAAGALYWSPQGIPNCTSCLWGNDGRALPPLEMLQNFVRLFPPGTELRRVDVSEPKVSTLASGTDLLVVNTSEASLTASVDGEDLDLKPYEIRWTKR